MISHCLVASFLTPRVRILRKSRAYTLGRDSKVELPLPSDIISRRHAEIQWSEGGGFAVRDLKSKNGTRVNDVPVVEERVLRDGDRVQIGPFTLQYREYRGDISGLLEEQELEEAEATSAMSRDDFAEVLASGGVAALRGFQGAFAGQELLEIVRLIGFGEKDGTLTIEGGGLRGQLAFTGGELRRAVASGLRGEAAAQALLAIKQGRFEFTHGEVGSGDLNCRLKADVLAMDVARRMDEGIAPPVQPASDDGAQTMRHKFKPIDPNEL